MAIIVLSEYSVEFMNTRFFMCVCTIGFFTKNNRFKAYMPPGISIMLCGTYTKVGFKLKNTLLY